jgi:phage gp29-like protein
MANKKPKSKSVPITQPIPDEVPLAEQFSRIGGTLSPGMVNSILSMADTGQIYRLVDLVHECRQKVGDLHAALAVSETAIGSLAWQISPPKDATKKESKACAELTDAMNQAERFRETIEHEAGESKLFGFAWSECIWRVADKGHLWPDKFKQVSCRRFGFRQADGALLFDASMQHDMSQGIDLLEAYAPGKFLFFQPRINGDILAREGVARAAVWTSMGINWSFKDWLALAELAWKPKRIGKYKKGTVVEEDRRALKAALERVMTAGVAIIPDSTEIELIWPQGAAAGGASSKSVHLELIEWCARNLAKMILGSSDILEPGTNGARSAVQERGKNPTAMRNATASGLAAAMNKHIVKPFFRYNYGERMRPGRFEFITKEPVNLKEFSDAISKLVASGKKVTESWVNAETGMPEAKTDDEFLKPPAQGPSGAAGSSSPDNGDSEPPPDGNNDSPDTQD